MRILRIHNRYQQRGGEDGVFAAESTLLERHGHRVEQLEFTNEDISDQRSPVDSAKLALNTIWSRPSRQRISAVVEGMQPEVVHFDNTFPLISAASYSTARASGAAVVQTLHNYRLLCPNALFYRDDHVCEDCLGKTPPYPGVVHACYRDSRTQTGAVAAMLTFHRLRRTWTRDVDRYIALTGFANRKFIEGGIPADRIIVKPHFVEYEPSSPHVDRAGFAYVGRLSPEKGISTLMDAWRQLEDVVLHVVGTGPLADTFRNCSPHVRLIGHQPRQEVRKTMATAEALVMPSEWYETFGLTIIEAYAAGTPVIASRLGAMEELVEDGVTGLLFTPGDADDLADKIRWAAEHPAEMRRMGENARREYEAKYTPERNYEMLMQIYHNAIDHRSRQGAY